MTYALCRPSPADQEVLTRVWLRSVKASHTFLRKKDLLSYLPLVRNAIASGDLELWAAFTGEHNMTPVGFMALDAAKVEALFIDPAFFRQGIGTQLLRHAYALKGPLTLDVNEANTDARVFYARLGFYETGRSPLDAMGKPYPLIHLACRDAPGHCNSEPPPAATADRAARQA